MASSVTKVELDAVEKLKSRNAVRSELESKGHALEDEDIDEFLLKFLRARELNLNKAEDMLLKHLRWRKENNIETILNWSPDTLKPDEYPYDITGVDKDGCPVMVVPCGMWDVRKVIETGMKGEYLKYVDQLFFRVSRAMKESSAKTGKNIGQFVIIFVPDDLPAFRQISCRQGVELVLETVRRFEANYPESLKKAFVVDTPRMFQIIFSMIRPLLNSKTLSKVSIAGGLKEWREPLLNLIEADQIPPRLGGTLVSKFPILNKARLRTRSITPDAIDLDPSVTFFSRVVPPGKRLTIEYSVGVPRTLLCWAFQTEKWDVGFSILYDGTEVVIPYSRPNSQESTQCGSLICDRSGKYVLVFDNTFSRWRAKTVRYRVFLRSEDDEENASPQEDSNTDSEPEQVVLHAGKGEEKEAKSKVQDGQKITELADPELDILRGISVSSSSCMDMDAGEGIVEIAD